MRTQEIIESMDGGKLEIDLDLDGSNVSRAYLLSRAEDVITQGDVVSNEKLYMTLATFNTLESIRFFITKFSFSQDERERLWVDEHIAIGGGGAD